MKWVFIVFFTGFLMVKDNVALSPVDFPDVAEENAVPWFGEWAQEDWKTGKALKDVKRGLVDQTDTILSPKLTLPVQTNNWMSVQGTDKWLGLSKDQIHKRQLNFDSPEYGIRAGAISLITRALRKNNKPEVSISQIFFDDDGWAEDIESYRLDTISKGYGDTDIIDVMNKDQLKPLINFISNHEMGVNAYNTLKDKENIIDRGINMAYEYVLSDDYSLGEFIK